MYWIGSETMMTNREMASVLFNVDTLLKDKDENPYRVRAYMNAARALMRRKDDVAAVIGSGQKLKHRKGVLGDRLQNRLRELEDTGDLELIHDLCADLPPHIEELMRVPGIGPRTADLLHKSLNVDTAEQLVRAARNHKVRTVWGFGAKREQNIAQLSLFEDAWMNETPQLQMAA